MGQRVHAGADGDLGRHAGGEFGISDDGVRQDLRMEDDFFDLLRRVGQYAGAADLGAGASRRGNGNNRRDHRAICTHPPVPDVLEIPDRAGLSSLERHQLAEIKTRATAERHHTIMIAGFERFDPRLKVQIRRVRLYVRKERGAQSNAK